MPTAMGKVEGSRSSTDRPTVRDGVPANPPRCDLCPSARRASVSPRAKSNLQPKQPLMQKGMNGFGQAPDGL